MFFRSLTGSSVLCFYYPVVVFVVEALADVAAVEVVAWFVAVVEAPVGVAVAWFAVAPVDVVAAEVVDAFVAAEEPADVSVVVFVAVVGLPAWPVDSVAFVVFVVFEVSLLHF